MDFRCIRISVISPAKKEGHSTEKKSIRFWICVVVMKSFFFLVQRY
jgi:hypothetical protein